MTKSCVVQRSEKPAARPLVKIKVGGDGGHNLEDDVSAGLDGDRELNRGVPQIRHTCAPYTVLEDEGHTTTVDVSLCSTGGVDVSRPPLRNTGR